MTVLLLLLLLMILVYCMDDKKPKRVQSCDHKIKSSNVTKWCYSRRQFAM